MENLELTPYSAILGKAQSPWFPIPQMQTCLVGARREYLGFEAKSAGKKVYFAIFLHACIVFSSLQSIVTNIASLILPVKGRSAEKALRSAGKETQREPTFIA